MQMEESALIKKESINPLELFAVADPGNPANPMEILLMAIRDEATGSPFDMGSASGRQACGSMAFRVARSKTLLDDIGKKLVSDIKIRAGKIDAVRKRARDYLDALKEEVRRPLTEYENAERARVDGIRNAIDRIKRASNAINDDGTPKTSRNLSTCIDYLGMVELTEDNFGEFLTEAHEAHSAAKQAAEDNLERRVRFERDQAELEARRAADAERERAEREEQLRKEGEEKARAEAAEKIKAAEEAAKQAERERIAAEERAKAEKEMAIQAERERAEREATEAEARKAALEADEKVRENVHATIRAMLIDHGIEADAASQVVAIVASGQIQYLKIDYSVGLSFTNDKPTSRSGRSKDK